MRKFVTFNASSKPKYTAVFIAAHAAGPHTDNSQGPVLIAEIGAIARKLVCDATDDLFLEGDPYIEAPSLARQNIHTERECRIVDESKVRHRRQTKGRHPCSEFRKI